MYNKFNDEPFFEWDESKNLANQQKHGVSFAEARSVFMDPNSGQAFDPDHSEGEDRFVLVGVSDRLRVLMVFYCYRREHSMIRIISARKVNATEENEYWRVIR